MDHTHEHIWLLIARKLSGEASQQELQELQELLRQYPDAGYSKEIFNDLWHAEVRFDRQYSESRYKELVQQIKTMGIDDGKFASTDHFINNEEQEEIIVKSSKKNWLIAFSVAAIVLIITACIYYLSGSEGNAVNFAEAQSKNQISTKNGSRTTFIFLPDGTKVWLNSSSQLTYDKTYGNKMREVSLIGEAFFDVVKNVDKPFVIHTGKMDIKVLGTAFNVKCYPEEKTTETSLVRGSLEVTLKDRQDKFRLKPNEKLVINNEDYAAAEVSKSKSLKGDDKVKTISEKPIASLTHITFLPADSTVVETAWVQNRLIFNSENFEDIALKMERWYNVKIEFADEKIKEEILTGNFEKETVVEAFEALQLTTPFSYTIKNDRITIYKKHQ